VPLHPILAAAYPVLFLFANNVADQVTLGPLWAPLGLSLAAALVLVVIGRFTLGDWRRGALLATLAAALFFSFGHVWFVVGEAITLRRYLIGTYCALGALGLIMIWRGGAWVVPLTRALNAFLLILVSLNTFTIADYLLSNASNARAAEPAAVEVDDRDRPDVFYVILDRYANNWTLEELYGFDNRPFLEALEERGFDVAEEAWANYLKTGLSLASSLDMSHLDGEALSADATPGNELGAVNPMLRGHLSGPLTFQSLGYEYVHIGTFWEPTTTNVDADVVFNYGDGLEFSTALAETTALSLLSPARAVSTSRTIYTADLVRRFHEYGFAQLEAAGRRAGPTFTFAHFLLPHPAYVYLSDGSAPTYADTQRPDHEQYVDQLQYTNRLVLGAIDAIISAPGGEDAVIVLQADEGPFPAAFDEDQRNFAWLEATPQQIAEKYGILNAIRIPGVAPEDAGFHGRSSPVNNLRIVMNGVFDAGLPLLPDTVFLTPDYSRLYEFVPVERGADGLPLLSDLGDSRP
jgi:hypothetical protein